MLHPGSAYVGTLNLQSLLITLLYVHDEFAQFRKFYH